MAAQVDGLPLGLQQDGTAALSYLKDSEPVAWLAAHADLSHRTKTASEFLFALSSEYAALCPLKRLLTDNFDTEQIWQQIDLQAAPLLASARRRLRHIERNTESVVLLKGHETLHERHTAGKDARKREDFEASQSEPEEEEEEEEGEKEAARGGEESEEEGEGHAVEDKFFKLRDMERFLDEAEAPQDFASPLDHDGDSSEAEDEDEDMQMDDVREDIEDNMEGEDEELKYNDFFAGGSKKKKADGGSQTDEPDHPQSPSTQLEPLTAHEKQIAKVQKRIEQLEKANLDSKLWTMQGEVSAHKRPKNSALEVELDFEHNVRPPPVITEEVTASLEDLIRNRIAENNFDDVQRKPFLPLYAPKERMEMDEKKSQKGLAELYEADYMQKTGLASASTTPADEIRKEATQLFKALCIKLDALSHFHFTPKPVIEDMAMRPDVPALAMEEVAPLMASDAQMLAPEEVFKGEGVVKAEAELSREERKRRRARKKEKAKVEKRQKELNNKPGLTTNQLGNFKGPSLQGKQKPQQSHYAKSTKVFDLLDQTNKNGKKQVVFQDLNVPFLKL